MFIDDFSVNGPQNLMILLTFETDATPLIHNQAFQSPCTGDWKLIALRQVCSLLVALQVEL